MKKKTRVFLSILLVFGIAALFASCDMLETGLSTKTPVSGDYTFGNLNQTLPNITAVTITAKSGKSPGAVSNIKYNNSATIPQAAGTYAVTFDVAAATGWNPADGLYAGYLTVDPANSVNQTPVAGDYTFGKLGQTAGSVTTVTITPKSEKSPGAVSNIKYSNSTTIPQTAGTYAVTFDVAAASGWNAATGLSAGNLHIYQASDNNQTPIASDYTIGKLGQTAGSVTAVTITPKNDKSPGAISNIRYSGNVTIPQSAGTYAVTFDVDAASGWNVATLSAGNLTVNAVGDTTQTPVSGDYTIGNLTRTAESVVTAVTITPNSGKSPGATTIYYQGIDGVNYPKSTNAPQAAGTYAVTFDVAAATGWYAVTGLSAGNLTVTSPGGVKQTPVWEDYDFDKLGQTAGSVTAVTITAKSGKSPGALTIYYQRINNTTYAKSTTVPQAAGTYAVTFDVAAATGWNAATGLSAGNLTVNAVGDTTKTPVSGDYTIVNLTQAAGSVTPVTITAKNGKSPGAVSNIKYSNSTTIPQTAGTYAVTFDVAAATGWYSATGLSAGSLTVTAANQTPVLADFTISGIGTFNFDGNAKIVSVTAKAGPSRTITVKYNNSTTAPSDPGTYTVTFDVAAAAGWNAVNGLQAGTLIITAANRTPVADDYVVDGLEQWTIYYIYQVTITPKPGRSPGTIYNIKYNDSIVLPQTAGSYPVTFDVAAAEGWNDAYGLYAGLLIVQDLVINFPEVSHYNISNLNQTAGSVIPVTVTRISTDNTVSSPGQISNIRYRSIEDIMNGDDGSENVPTKAGTYIVNFNVAQAPGWYGTELGAILIINLPGSTTIPTNNGLSAVNTGSEITITGYTGSAGAVTIPSNYSGTPVTKIGDFAFVDFVSYEGKVTSVTIGSNVITIGDYAFWGNQLTSVTIPDSVTTIGYFAFAENQLTSVTIGNGVTSIGVAAFAENRLTSVTIGNSVATIGEHAFSHNELAGVTIPDSVTTIGASAFSSNYELTTVTIGNSVATIGEHAFSNNELTSVTIPDSVTTIGAGAFWGNQLTSVTIGANVTLGSDEYSGAFPGNFNNVYNGGKLAGTYTCDNPGAFNPTWIKQ
jgi:hypothetical protein